MGIGHWELSPLQIKRAGTGAPPLQTVNSQLSTVNCQLSTD
ncbi:hypothetical protein [Microcoleus sp. CAWBG58]|nr:hypothetical protein [Microcoleus sp. CAWBG58]